MNLFNITTDPLGKRWDLQIPVVGVTFDNRQTLLQELCAAHGCTVPLSLRRESKNQYDPNAIAVYAHTDREYKVGYVPRKPRILTTRAYNYTAGHSLPEELLNTKTPLNLLLARLSGCLGSLPRSELFIQHHTHPDKFEVYYAYFYVLLEREEHAARKQELMQNMANNVKLRIDPAQPMVYRMYTLVGADE